MFSFFKQKPAYGVGISDWSSDVCASDLASWDRYEGETFQTIVREWRKSSKSFMGRQLQQLFLASVDGASARPLWNVPLDPSRRMTLRWAPNGHDVLIGPTYRSEEHTSELQSLMRISYAVFCLKKKNNKKKKTSKKKRK